ncbi:hypothetical protein Micbo1qcDRAFT_156036 [Microdochium bolleyi]|uniref:Uncharacterized protein n=1 Tax=Microdochium bolleyi TaxID=196109 RepID=A0A136JJ89_9PEZI|nr:hypothetical protein Micbo1qcDRAFT_156036 [Microdochium bolleyi]
MFNTQPSPPKKSSRTTTTMILEPHGGQNCGEGGSNTRPSDIMEPKFCLQSDALPAELSPLVDINELA